MNQSGNCIPSFIQYTTAFVFNQSKNTDKKFTTCRFGNIAERLAKSSIFSLRLINVNYVDDLLCVCHCFIIMT